MRLIILGDARNDFLSDVTTSMMLEGYPFQLIQARTLTEVQTQANKNPGAEVVISESLLDGTPVDIRNAYGFSFTPSGNGKVTSSGLNFIGMFRTSGALLDTLTLSPLPIVAGAASGGGNITSTVPQQPVQHAQNPAQNNTKKPQQTPRAETPRNEPRTQNAQTSPAQRNEPTQQPYVQQAPVEPAPVQQPVQAAPAQPSPQIASGGAMTPEMFAMMAQFMQQMGMAPGTVPGAPVAPAAPQPAPVEQEPVAPVQNNNTAHVSPAEKIREQQAEQKAQETEKAVNEDILARSMNDTHKTRVISVYAAKGGVGKTSISTELAVCLALTTNGRRRFRVCIIDYNIDFGDVATTLEFRDDGVTMSYWAAEIREMLERGDDPENIKFTRQQMEECYLQKMEDTGLYALCAPITHEDSMLIKPAELEIMLRSIVENGQFDYVICDTGNNTRDSSIIAIDNSDYVLLVATQDVTTANCNASVLRTLGDSGFDTDKVRLVINNIMPSRETGVSVQEVEEAFPYKCVCRIKRTPDIIRANNLSRPLVYKPNHEYTKQIQRIVRFVTAGEIVEDTPKKKKGLFGRRK